MIPKSSHRERIVENSRIFDFSLARAPTMAALDGLDRTGGTGEAVAGQMVDLGGRARSSPRCW